MGLYKQEFIEDRKHEDVFLLWKLLLRLGEEDKLSHVCPFYLLGTKQDVLCLGMFDVLVSRF